MDPSIGSEELMKQFLMPQSMLAGGSGDEFDNATQFTISHNDASVSGDFSSGLSVSPPPLAGHSESFMDEFTGVLEKPDQPTSISSLILPTTSSQSVVKNPIIILNNQLDSLSNQWTDSILTPVASSDLFDSAQSNLLIVLDNKSQQSDPVEDHNFIAEDEKEEEEEQPFDYSIFLNKPTSPASSEKVVEEVESDETVSAGKLEGETSPEDKVNELLEENQVIIGSILPDHSSSPSCLPCYKCDLCSSSFNRKGNYTRHRMTHFVKSKTTTFRYKCEVCSRNFLQKCDLVRHMHIHDKTEPYRCEICDKGYIRRKDLEVHLRFHRGEKTHHCTECAKSFFSTGDLNRHMRGVHCLASKLKCGHCQRRFTREATLIQHMQTKHNEMILLALRHQIDKVQQLPIQLEVEPPPAEEPDDSSLVPGSVPVIMRSAVVTSVPMPEIFASAIATDLASVSGVT